VWFHAFKGAVEVSASVGTDGTIVVGANTAYEYGFTPGGHEKWRVSLDRSLTYSSPAVTADGLAYFGDNNGYLRVVRAATGQSVATERGLRGLWAAQAIDEHHDVYFGTQGGRVYGYTAQGHRLFDLTASGPIDSYPALTGDGTLIIGDEKGTLYAIG
jgi:outer membrane protein assembly factor BamB